jgi:SAM-dependent methyltransferase
MVYSSIPKAVDYSHSIYEMPGAIGSGVSVHDHQRLDEIAATVRKYCDKDDIRILDVGCGQGGLLAALERHGFGKQTGLDPSPVCCKHVHELGYSVIRGYLADVTEKFDYITLSHVLEHVPDAEAFLCQLIERLNPFGRVYIEVPNASRYAEFSNSIPFLDFNSEHINHFEMATLLNLLRRCGLTSVESAYKTMTLVNGSQYPSMWVIAERKSSYFRITQYITNSKASLEVANNHIEKSLGNAKKIAIWGAGEYLAHILALPAVASRKVIQIVDRNPALHGESIAGCKVGPPSSLSGDVPVVIAAIVASPAIKKEAELMGLKPITLEFR